LLLHVDEEAVATGEAPDDEEPLRVRVIDVCEVNLDDFAERQEIIEVAVVDLEIRLPARPVVPIVQRRVPLLA